VSIPFILGNGVYLFSMFDQFAGGLPLLIIGFFEFIAVAWVYGTKRSALLESIYIYTHACIILIFLRRFFKTFVPNHNKRARYLWTILWKFVGPVIMVIIFVGSIIREIISPLSYTVYRNVS